MAKYAIQVDICVALVSNCVALRYTIQVNSYLCITNLCTNQSTLFFVLFFMLKLLKNTITQTHPYVEIQPTAIAMSDIRRIIHIISRKLIAIIRQHFEYWKVFVLLNSCNGISSKCLRCCLSMSNFTYIG